MFASSNFVTSTLLPDQTAADTNRRKCSKYLDILITCKMQPVALETSGACGLDTLLVFYTVGRIAAERRHKPGEHRWLMERLSTAILRGDAI